MNDPLESDKFMQSANQKWCAVFISCLAGILFVDAVNSTFDPVPYTQFLLAIGTTFILGQSGKEWARSMKVGSIRQEEVKQETVRMEKEIKAEDDSSPKTQIVQHYQEQYGNDESYAPLPWIHEQATSEFR